MDARSRMRIEARTDLMPLTLILHIRNYLSNHCTGTVNLMNILPCGMWYGIPRSILDVGSLQIGEMVPYIHVLWRVYVRIWNQLLKKG